MKTARLSNLVFEMGLALMVLANLCMAPQCCSQDSKDNSKSQTTYACDFESGLADWKIVDSECWKIEKIDSNHVLSLFRKKSEFKPKFRSPYHIALFKLNAVGDFQLDVKILSTHKDYDHRDVCLFFGYQSPSKYYYVHLGKRMDPRANQIFIVNESARTKISKSTTDGTAWDDQWHNVRIVRKTKSGEILVYFDDMTKPVMTATDDTFLTGQVGLGSFDDTADFDDFKLIDSTNTDQKPPSKENH